MMGHWGAFAIIPPPSCAWRCARHCPGTLLMSAPKPRAGAGVELAVQIGLQV